MSSIRKKNNTGILVVEDLADLVLNLEKMGYRLRVLTSTEKKVLENDWPENKDIILATPGGQPGPNEAGQDQDLSGFINREPDNPPGEGICRAGKMLSLEKVMPGLTHELNNSISFITLNTPILRKIWQDLGPVLELHDCELGPVRAGGYGLDELGDEVFSLLDYMIAGADKIKRVINALNCLVDPGVPDRNPFVRIDSAVETALDLTQNIIKKSTVEFSVDLGQIPLVFYGNFQQVVQVLINVVVAMSQAGPNQGKTMALKTYHDRELELIVVEIQGNDHGNPEQSPPTRDAPGVWFQGIDETVAIDPEMTARIMKDHGGMIQRFFSPGQGSIVRLGFPVKAETGPGGEAES